jgi:hypothetical protein
MLLQRLRVSLALLTERRAVLYAATDALLLLAGLFRALSGGGRAAGFYAAMFLIPLLLIAVPMMSEALAVERRSGTLDLALTLPDAAFYFERRILVIVALVVAHGWLTLAVPWLLVEHFPLSGPLLQICVVALFIGAVVLNWAARVKSAGAVAFLTYATCLAFTPWFFSNPIRPLDAEHGPMSFGDYLEYARHNGVLLIGAVIFYLYARQRLARPELLVT